MSVLFFVCVGCTTITVTPEVSVFEKVGVLMTGQIQYDGKREYLPRSISEAPMSEHGLTFRYSTTEAQNRSGWDIIALFNPLTILGSPTGSLTSTLSAKLDIIKETEVIKSYTATCIQTATKGIYYGESFSELRRKGLLVVRDNIETQMFQDREYLTKAMNGAIVR
ncbi:MAG TPA: hypothetical protein VKB81_07850 [Nitrospira sp.]|nr:hypothetical protein [Nitrospira sp.]